jgi:hypothetical protein
LSLLLRHRRLLKHHEVVFLQQIALFRDLLETGSLDLRLKHVLSGPDMVEYPIRALALFAAKVDQHQTAPRFQCPMQ